MDLYKLQDLNMYLNKPTYSIRIPSNIIHPYDITKVNEYISLIAKKIEATDPNISEKLIQDKEYLFHYNNDRTVNPNPVALGKIMAYIDLILESEVKKQFDEWDCIHPLIIKSFQKLYIDGNYAEAAVNAFIEINARVKKYIK